MNRAIRDTNVIIGVKPGGGKTVKQPTPQAAKDRYHEVIEMLDANGKYLHEVVVWYGAGRMIKSCTCKGTPVDTDGGGTTDFAEKIKGTDPADATDDN